MNKLTKMTKDLFPPEIFVERNNSNEITVTEIAKTARKPVLTPRIVKTIDAISPELVASKIFDRTIFSGDANLGTLSIALIKNKKNNPTEIFFALF